MNTSKHLISITYWGIAPKEFVLHINTPKDKRTYGVYLSLDGALLDLFKILNTKERPGP